MKRRFFLGVILSAASLPAWAQFFTPASIIPTGAAAAPATVSTVWTDAGAFKRTAAQTVGTDNGSLTTA